MKLFAGLNAWALPLAAVVSFLFGGVWYGILAKHWMEALGRSETEMKASRPSPVPFAVTFIAQLIMAWVLAGVILHLAKAGIAPGLGNGMIVGALLWLGFVLMPLVVNHQFQMQSPKLTAIDGLHWLGVLLIQGAILGMWGLA